MTANDYLKSYQLQITSKTTDEDKLRISKNILNIKQYVPYYEKCKIIKKMLYELYSFNSLSSAVIQIHFVETMLQEYTDLEILSDTYDILEETNTLNYIVTLFQTEYEKCAQILNMYLDDLRSERLNYEDLLSTNQ